MKRADDGHVELLAETMHAGFYSDDSVPADKWWADLSPIVKGRWRRAARAALNAIEGNRHWLPGHAERNSQGLRRVLAAKLKSDAR